MMLQKLLILTAWLIWNIIQSSASLWEHPSSLSMGFGRFIWPYSLLCYLKHSFLPFLFDPPKYEFFSFLLFFTHSINTCWIATFCIVKRQYRLLRSVNLGCYSLTFFSPLTPTAFYTVSFCWSLAALITWKKLDYFTKWWKVSMFYFFIRTLQYILWNHQQESVNRLFQILTFIFPFQVTFFFGIRM